MWRRRSTTSTTWCGPKQLGYSLAWFADSQMIWSDVYACLALAATRTRTIELGTGVSVVGTRIAPVTAASIATINRLAPAAPPWPSGPATRRGGSWTTSR